MEAYSWCKDLWTPKTFNRFSFVANVVWITSATVFVAIFLDIEFNEPRFDWSCALNNADADRTVQENCFVEYEGLYNKLSVPPCLFVFGNFSLPFIVCAIYSRCAKPRVTRLSSLVNRAVVERGQNKTVNSSRQRKLFTAYFSQLITRLCLGIVFIIFLQTEVFYPRKFPSNFKCNVMRGEVNQTANATGNAHTQTYECNNQRAQKKTSWMYALSWVDGIFAFILLIEIFIILSRVRKGKQFMNDPQFYTDHLKSNYDPQEELSGKQNSRQEITQRLISQQELQDSQEEENHEILETEHGLAAESNKLSRDTHQRQSNPAAAPSLVQTICKMKACTWCKDLLTPKPFNRFSFVANVVWIIIATVFVAIFLDIEFNEPRFDWSCALNNADADRTVQENCFVEYEGLYNKLSVPPCLFVFGNFSLPFIVCAIYSRCAKPRVTRLSSLVNRAVVERGQNKTVNSSRQRKLFTAYFSQLIIRLCLGIVFIIFLRTELFYPRKFPSNFNCIVTRGSVYNQTANATGKAQTQTYECSTQRAHKKALWMYALRVVDAIFTSILFSEIFIILSRVRKGKQFMNDPQFYTDHLKSNYDPQEELSGKQNSRQEITLRLISQPELQDSQEGENHEILETEQTEHLPQLQTCFKCMKESILKNTEGLRELSSPFKPNPGEGDRPKDLKLNQIYTNLIVYPGRAYYHFPENRREQLKVYPKPEKNLPPKAPGDIVDDLHKNILIVGRPGIGKTLFCTKFMRDWASDRLFDEAKNSELRFDVAFLVKFRRLNSAAELNLRELLDHSEFSTNMTDVEWDYILENQSRVLFIFDGIDEYSERKKIQEDDSIYKDTVEEKMPLHALYTKIMAGKLLGGATVLTVSTTTRPTAESCIRNPDPSRVVEILGFSSGQVKNYVEKYTGDDKGAGETIWQHISNNLNLFSLCYIPANCFIICSCLLYMLQSFHSNSVHGLTSLATKLTDVYSFAVKIIFFRHSNRYRNKTVGQDQIFTKFDELDEEVKGDFKKLGTIAFKGIKEGTLTFESDEVANLEDCGLLHRLPDLKPEAKRPFEKPKAQYSFQHLTIQEFFAAKHLTDNMGEAELREFVTSHITDGAWQVVLQFVAGLLGDREKPLTDIFTNLLPASTYKEKEDELEPGILTCWPRKEDGHLALTLCHCLYDIDADDSTVRNKVREIDFNAVVFKDCKLGPVDCNAIASFLKMHNEILMIDLSGNKIGCLGCKEISEFLVFCTSVRDGNCKLNSLNLSHNIVTDEGVKYLAKALKHSNCKLHDLNLTGDEFTDEGVKYLAEALKHSNCKLHDLNLTGNKITDEGVKYLAEALKHSNCKLHDLNLTGNKITDEGVKYLAEALKDSNTKLHHLNLTGNKFTNVQNVGVKYLAEALKDSNCKLSSLDLACNKFTDEGVKYLAEALNDSNCKLTSLNVTCNKFTDEGVKYLAEALKDSNSPCKLSTLDLENIKLTDEGVKYLAEAVKDSNCKLSSLDLACNKFTDEGVKYLAEALNDSNCKLSSLNLECNKLTDEGVKYLAEALKHSNCKLSSLNLARNELTDEGLKYLAEALKDSFCKLCSLNLAYNQLSDEDKKYLEEVLKYSNCKLIYS